MVRASSMLAMLRLKEWEKALALNKEKGIPEFKVGDAIEVKVSQPPGWKAASLRYPPLLPLLLLHHQRASYLGLAFSVHPCTLLAPSRHAAWWWKMLSHLSAQDPDIHRGVVLSIVKRGHDSWFSLADVSVH